jgi:hypothetical protein
MRRTNKTGDERQESGEPPTPGLAASPPAESNFLSVRHGPSGHQQSMKRQGLTTVDASDGDLIFRAVWCRPASLGPFVIGMENQHGEFGWQPA